MLNELNGELITDALLHNIIDELHPEYVASTNEKMLEDYEDFGVFGRSFRHTSGKTATIRWAVYYGTPETVVTKFTSISNK